LNAGFLGEPFDFSQLVTGRWAFAILGAAIVLVAFLVNRFAPSKRRKIRRAVILYGLYLLTLAMSEAVSALHEPAWAMRYLPVAVTLLVAFIVINLGALLVFDLALPLIGIELVSITSDLLIFLAYLVATAGSLNAAGMDTSHVVAGTALLGTIITFSMQSTLGNVVGGIALQVDGSIHVGDWIQLDNGKQGLVKEIRWRHTVVETRDWDTIIVPNASLLAGNITILGKRVGKPVQHRMWVYFNVDFRFAPTQVIETVETALRSTPIEGVAADPPPNCIAYDFAKDTRDSFAYYAVRYWLTDLAADDPTSSRVRVRLYAALKRAGIPLALPARALFLKQSGDETTKDQHWREKRFSVLEGLELFKALTEKEREQLCEHLIHAPFAKGEIVTKQGAVAHWLYILMKGTVDIVAHTDDGRSRRVATLEGPSFFGEMGLMTGEPRANDVVAMTDVECWRLDKEGFQSIIRARPEIAAAMSKTMAQRRVELEAVRDGLDEEAKSKRMISEERALLERIERFFGLGDRPTLE
jgi:small-conductance mechanosensitive channel/CRP-like cAMP-binding protein